MQRAEGFCGSNRRVPPTPDKRGGGGVLRVGFFGSGAEAWEARKQWTDFVATRYSINSARCVWRLEGTIGRRNEENKMTEKRKRKRMEGKLITRLSSR